MKKGDLVCLTSRTTLRGTIRPDDVGVVVEVINNSLSSPMYCVAWSMAQNKYYHKETELQKID